MYDAILLPTTGGPEMNEVINHVGSLADRYDATVHVLSVMDARNRFESPASGIAGNAWDDGERSRAHEAVADADAALPDVTTERIVRSGVPHEEILEYVRESSVQLVVMGTHGRTGLDHYLIGSVAERVVRRCAVPVLTVPLADSE
jgi:nucleotide-binding universal stress UspA family protein